MSILPSLHLLILTLQGGALTERRVRREARSRPWLTGSTIRSRRSVASSTPPALLAPPRTGGAVASTTTDTKGKGKGVSSAPVSRLAAPREISDAKTFVRHTRNAAFACGSRLPRLATKSCSEVSAKLGADSEKKAGSAAGVVKSHSPSIPSKELAGSQRVENGSAPKPDG